MFNFKWSVICFIGMICLFIGRTVYGDFNTDNINSIQETSCQKFEDGKCILCEKNEYLTYTDCSHKTSICTPCPKNAHCNGKRGFCEMEYYTKFRTEYKDDCSGVLSCVEDSCPSCDGSIFYHPENSCECLDCPEHAICDGVSATGCISGYRKITVAGRVQCVDTFEPEMSAKKRCKQNEYYSPSITGDKCMACPRHGICNGTEVVRCENGYEKMSCSEAVGCIAHNEKCLSNEFLMCGNFCWPCPEHATCDGVYARCNPGYMNIVRSPYGGLCVEDPDVQQPEKVEKQKYERKIEINRKENRKNYPKDGGI